MRCGSRFLDKDAPHPLPVPPLNRLRSNLIIAIVSLFVLTGFASDVLDFCCEAEKQELTSHATDQSDKSAPVKSDDCQCLCHQFFTSHAVEPLRVVPTVLTPADFVAHADEFPPDAAPLGIDYPPQLA